MTARVPPRLGEFLHQSRSWLPPLLGLPRMMLLLSRWFLQLQCLQQPERLLSTTRTTVYLGWVGIRHATGWLWRDGWCTAQGPHSCTYCTLYTFHVGDLCHTLLHCSQRLPPTARGEQKTLCRGSVIRARHHSPTIIGVGLARQLRLPPPRPSAAPHGPPHARPHHHHCRISPRGTQPRRRTYCPWNPCPGTSSGTPLPPIPCPSRPLATAGAIRRSTPGST
jgi:hypothetical protein